MIYGPSYEGKTRECEACGHVTNVHYSCDVCEKHVCEECDHGALGEHYCSPECFQETCSHDRLKLDVDGLFVCRDCGALLDDEDIVEIRRAA